MNLKAAIMLCITSSIGAAQELPTYWSRSVVGHPINFERRALAIFIVGYSMGGYYVDCGLSNQSSHVVRVVGARDKSGDFPGEFRVKATLSVSHNREGPWRTVTKVIPNGRATTVVVTPHSNSEAVIVDLNKLAPLVDEFAYAKISLPTGEATIFATKELKN